HREQVGHSITLAGSRAVGDGAARREIARPCAAARGPRRGARRARSHNGVGRGRAGIALVLASWLVCADRAVSVGSGPTAPAGTLDVRRLIDERPVSGFQIGVAVLCGAIVFLDGYDALIMAYVAPALRAQFHIAQPALGPVLSYGLIGMMVGALLFGPL